MRISDWSSDVCSPELRARQPRPSPRLLLSGALLKVGRSARSSVGPSLFPCSPPRRQPRNRPLAMLFRMEVIEHKRLRPFRRDVPLFSHDMLPIVVLLLLVDLGTVLCLASVRYNYTPHSP